MQEIAEHKRLALELHKAIAPPVLNNFPSENEGTSFPLTFLKNTIFVMIEAIFFFPARAKWNSSFWSA